MCPSPPIKNGAIKLHKSDSGLSRSGAKLVYPQTLQLLAAPFLHGLRLRNVRGFIFFDENKRSLG
jgi:hypothetical protein